MLEPGTLLQQGRFEILRSIKAGGMGAVYEARATHLRCTVALKESLVSNDYSMRRAFEREAHLLANLRHRALPRVIDHFVEGDGHFLVMDFIQGDDLATMLHQRGREPFPADQVLRWADDLLCALDYLHTRKPPIIHRDIKPLNIKLTDDDQIVLLDFGLAKGNVPHSSSHSTNKSSLQGFSPHYAPVEQITGKGTDARSDLYSLAATLYHLVTGKAPPDAMARAGQILSGDPDPLKPANELNPDVRPAFADLLLKSMSYNRDHRPESAALIRQMLREITKDHQKVTLTDLSGEDIYKTRKTEDKPVASQPAVKTFTFDTVTLDDRGDTVESRKSEASYFMEDLGHCVGMEMVYVPEGEFVMGSDASEPSRRPNEGPQRRVSVSAFYIGKFQISQEQWRTVADLPTVKLNLRQDPATFKGDSLPVDAVFWEEAVEFCDRLSAKTGRRYRLPSEAEWEYAARAGSTTAFAFGPTITAELVNYNGNYPYAAAPKGAYREETTILGQLGVANALGLFDMHGNVWEWCQDEYHDNYNGAPTNASPWEGRGTGEKILRGGSWYCDSRMCRSAFRLRIAANSINNAVGFRVVVQ